MPGPQRGPRPNSVTKTSGGIIEFDWPGILEPSSSKNQPTITHGVKLSFDNIHKAARMGLEGPLGARSWAPKAVTSIATAAVLYGASKEARDNYKLAREWYKNRSRYTVNVEHNDDLYPGLYDWLMEQVPEVDHKAVTARTKYRNGDYVLDSDGDPVRQRRSLAMDHERTINHPVQLDSHTVVVSLKIDNVLMEKESDDDAPKSIRSESIVFTAESLAGQRAVVKFLEARLNKMNTSSPTKPRLFVPSQKSYWKEQFNAPRPIDSLALRDGIAESLVDNLGDFLKAEKEYLRKGIPYHRGYLFSGPSGSGKTSLAKALACHFKLNVYYIALGSIESDSHLNDLVQELSPKSVLLLEDIDVFHAATSREEKFGLTLSGLLNILDGISTPHGMVTFMSTNNRDALDPALIRPGRVDMDVYVDYADTAQANKLFTTFYGEDLQTPLVVPEGTLISPAGLSEQFKRHMRDPRQGELAAHDYIALSSYESPYVLQDV